MADRYRTSLLVLIAILFYNVFACAIFSNVLERYQGRVIWLLPLYAAFLIIDYLQALPRGLMDKIRKTKQVPDKE